MSSPAEEKVYHPKDTIGATLNATMLTGGAGFVASAVQNTLQKRNVGSWGVFTRTGGTIGLFAAMGGTYAFVKNASANLREKDDHWNVTLGGFFSGAILGLRRGSFPSVLGCGVTLAAVLGTFEYTGGNLFGHNKDPHADEFDRRTDLRKRYQSPAEETFAELGEGRGIYAADYQERRRERIKQKYGIELPETQPSAS